jgi:hypothetical protein
MPARLSTNVTRVAALLCAAALAVAACSLTTSLDGLSGGKAEDPKPEPTRTGADASPETPVAEASAPPCDVSRSSSCGLCGRVCEEGAACTSGVCDRRGAAASQGTVQSIVVGDGSAAWIGASNDHLVTWSLAPPAPAVLEVPTPSDGSSRDALRALGRRGKTTVGIGTLGNATQGWVASYEAGDAGFTQRGAYGPVATSVAIVGANPLIVVAIVDVSSGARQLRGCSLSSSCGDLSNNWSNLGTTDLDAIRLAASDETLLIMGVTGPSVGALDACIPSSCASGRVRLLESFASPSALAARDARAFVGTTAGDVISVGIADKQRMVELNAGAPVKHIEVTTKVLYVLDTQGRLTACRRSPAGGCDASQRYTVARETIEAFAADDVDVVAATTQGDVLRLTP